MKLLLPVEPPPLLEPKLPPLELVPLDPAKSALPPGGRAPSSGAAEAQSGARAGACASLHRAVDDLVGAFGKFLVVARGHGMSSIE
jgi:hypothetical protein